MRTEGTQQTEINILPENALPVSTYARQVNTAVGYVYIKYKRYQEGKGKKPDYEIRCYKGMNYVIPD